MKTAQKLIMTVFAVAVLAICLPAAYAEGDLWEDDAKRRPHYKKGLTEEKINELMKELAEDNPEKAERLEQLRNEKPDIFKAQIRRIARGKGAEHQRGRRSGFGSDEGGRRPKTRRGPRGGRGGEMTRQKETEVLQWLEKNNPEKAEELTKLKEENRRLYIKKMSRVIRKYSKIIEAEKTNPALAAVLTEDLELKGQTRKLMKKIKAATDEDEKQALKSELEPLIGKRFDLIIKKKQFRYEGLLKKLEELKDKINESEAELEKMKGKKSDHIKERLEALINKTEKVNWK